MRVCIMFYATKNFRIELKLYRRLENDVKVVNNREVPFSADT